MPKLIKNFLDNFYWSGSDELSFLKKLVGTLLKRYAKEEWY